MIEINERVGAFLSVENGIVNFLGYGVHEGDEVPPNNVSRLLNLANIPNPKIKLDSGEVVYGCECWWGPEEKIKKQMAQYDESKIKLVSITDFREKEFSEEVN